MTIEDRMRRAWRSAPEPEGDGWERIQAKVTAASRRRRVQRTAVGVLAAAAVVAVAFGAAAMLSDDGGDQTVDVGPADTTSTTATTEAPSTSTTTTTAPVAETDPFVWRGDATTPEDAAVGFMRDFVGVPAPVVAGVHQGDSRSWEVDVVPRPGLDGLMTTVLVREDGDRLGVLASLSRNIELDSPEAGDLVASPTSLAGRASAFEGHVDVEVRDDFGRTIGTGFVTGNGGVELGPFGGEIDFEPTEAEAGALILSTASAEDGSVQEATVIRVGFVTASVCAAPEQSVPEPVVEVYLLCPGTSLPAVVAVPRTAPDAGVLRAALEHLLAGPNTVEAEAGLVSMFSKDTARMLRGVRIEAGRAVVDFERELAEAIPNGSSSAGSAALLAQLDATVFQFENIDRVEYQLGGSCEDFGAWLQRGCESRERP